MIGPVDCTRIFVTSRRCAEQATPTYWERPQDAWTLPPGTEPFRSRPMDTPPAGQEGQSGMVLSGRWDVGPIWPSPLSRLGSSSGKHHTHNPQPHAPDVVPSGVERTGMNMVGDMTCRNRHTALLRTHTHKDPDPGLRLATEVCHLGFCFNSALKSHSTSPTLPAPLASILNFPTRPLVQGPST